MSHATTIANYGPQQKLIVPIIARMFGIAPIKVLRWIAAGELKATNLATTPHGRPRWAVSPDDLEAFERSRSNVPATRKSDCNKGSAR